MGRRSSASQSQANSISIKWTGHPSQMLAYKMKEEYKAKFLTGNKIQVVRQWAIDIGIGPMDEKGERTKAQVHQLLKKYKNAKEMQMKTGFGDTTKITIMKGKEVETIWTVKQQILDICPLYDILDSFLGDAYRDSISVKSVRASESELHQPLKINGKSYPSVPLATNVDDDDLQIDPQLYDPPAQTSSLDDAVSILLLSYNNIWLTVI